MKINSQTKNDRKRLDQTLVQVVGELLAVIWLLVVSIQYIVRYYIIIPTIDYQLVYIVLLCIVILYGVVKLMMHIISNRARE